MRPQRPILDPGPRQLLRQWPTGRPVQQLGGRRLGAVEPKHDDRPDGLAPACVLASRESRNIIRNVMPEDDPILVALAAIEEEILARESGDVLGNEMYAYAGR